MIFDSESQVGSSYDPALKDVLGQIEALHFPLSKPASKPLADSTRQLCDSARSLEVPPARMFALPKCQLALRDLPIELSRESERLISKFGDVVRTPDTPYLLARLRHRRATRYHVGSANREKNLTLSEGLQFAMHYFGVIRERRVCLAGSSDPSGQCPLLWHDGQEIRVGRWNPAADPSVFFLTCEDRWVIASRQFAAQR